MGTGPLCFNGALHWAGRFYVVHYRLYDNQNHYHTFSNTPKKVLTGSLRNPDSPGWLEHRVYGRGSRKWQAKMFTCYPAGSPLLYSSRTKTFPLEKTGLSLSREGLLIISQDQPETESPEKLDDFHISISCHCPFCRTLTILPNHGRLK